VLAGFYAGEFRVQFRPAMEQPLRFLIIDDNADSRALLVRTLVRRYPQAVIHECYQADTALALARREKLSAIVTHRTYDFDGVALVALLRAANATVPILMVSGRDRAKDAVRAGANRFLSYEEWLRVGDVMAGLLAETRSPFASDPSSSREPLPA
jgi:ActR/RegA family two-component response regulator